MKTPIFFITAALVIFTPAGAAAQQNSSSAEPVKQREAFVGSANTFKGTPYKLGGTEKKKGVDCSGLIYASAIEALNKVLPRTANALYTTYDAIADIEREPGDLIFFSTGSTRKVNHVGIYLGNNEVLHALSEGASKGVTVSPLSKPYWQKAYVSAARFLDPAKTKVAKAERETMDNGKLLDAPPPAPKPAVKPAVPAQKPTPAPAVSAPAVAVSQPTSPAPAVKPAVPVQKQPPAPAVSQPAAPSAKPSVPETKPVPAAAPVQIAAAVPPMSQSASSATAQETQQAASQSESAAQQTAQQPLPPPPENPAQIKRDRFLAACRQVLGTPYRDGGTSKSGVDNIGLIYAIARDVFGATTFPNTLEMLYSAAKRVPETIAEPGDVIFFQKDGYIFHVGVYLGNSQFIHAWDGGGYTIDGNPINPNAKTGVIQSSMKETEWSRAYAGIAQIFQPTKIAAEPVKGSDTAVNPSAMNPLQKRTKFIESAKKVIGVPYAEGGTTSAGVDDAGLIYAIARDVFGAQIPYTTADLFYALPKVKAVEAEPGDILFFQKDGYVVHTGIYIGNSQFIHSTDKGDKTGVILSSTKTEPWNSALYAIGRLFDSGKTAK